MLTLSACVCNAEEDLKRIQVDIIWEVFSLARKSHVSVQLQHVELSQLFLHFRVITTPDTTSNLAISHIQLTVNCGDCVAIPKIGVLQSTRK